MLVAMYGRWKDVWKAIDFRLRTLWALTWYHHTTCLPQFNTWFMHFITDRKMFLS